MPICFERYVALGDSQTEGLNDGDQLHPRGWADRLAQRLVEVNPGLRYANLAIRGCRARHVRTVQLPAALSMRPDLASVVVGMNDMLRHDFDLDATLRDVEETMLALQAAGAHVVSMTFPDIDKMIPIMSWLAPRERELNDRVRALCKRLDVPLLDLSGLEMTADPAMWSHDRIHGSAQGHARIAAGMAELMGLPGANHDWTVPPAAAASHWLRDLLRDAHWVGTFMAPWLVRQLTGRNGYHIRLPKRPELTPVLGPDD